MGLPLVECIAVNVSPEIEYRTMFVTGPRLPRLESVKASLPSLSTFQWSSLYHSLSPATARALQVPSALNSNTHFSGASGTAHFPTKSPTRADMLPEKASMGRMVQSMMIVFIIYFISERHASGSSGAAPRAGSEVASACDCSGLPLSFERAPLESGQAFPTLIMQRVCAGCQLRLGSLQVRRRDGLDSLKDLLTRIPSS